MSEIHTYDVKIEGTGGDWGDSFKVKCPECGDEVVCVEFSTRGPRCSCGYEWSVGVVATGAKND